MLESKWLLLASFMSSGKPYQELILSILTLGSGVSFQGRTYGDLSLSVSAAAERHIGR